MLEQKKLERDQKKNLNNKKYLNKKFQLCLTKDKKKKESRNQNEKLKQETRMRNENSIQCHTLVRDFENNGTFAGD